MTNVVLLTVWHTGTNYFVKGLQNHYGNAAFEHLNYGWKSGKDDLIYTTYRDPIRVAASWSNRRRFGGNGMEQWMGQWGDYSNLSKLNPLIFDVSKGVYQHGIKFPDKPLNTYPDRFGMHKALDEGDMDTFYKEVPRAAIDYAIKCSGWVHNIQEIK